MLKSDNIKLRPTHQREIPERTKTRLITISPFFPNQIFDYLMIELVKPMIKTSMYKYCIGNVDGRGITYGKKYLEKVVKKYTYFMKLDIRKFYHHINTSILIQMFERKIKDTRFINFMRKILITKSLPIGCYYSQWLANFYLCSFDHAVKEEMRAKMYVRYVDDIVLASNNKRSLTSIYYHIKRKLALIELELKFRPTIRKLATFSINFIGYLFGKYKIRLRHHIFYSIKRTVEHIKIHLCYSLVQRLISYFSWLKSIKSGFSYYINNIVDVISIGRLRRIVSNRCI